MFYRTIVPTRELFEFGQAQLDGSISQSTLKLLTKEAQKERKARQQGFQNPICDVSKLSEARQAALNELEPMLSDFTSGKLMFVQTNWLEPGDCIHPHFDGAGYIETGKATFHSLPRYQLRVGIALTDQIRDGQGVLQVEMRGLRRLARRFAELNLPSAGDQDAHRALKNAELDNLRYHLSTQKPEIQSARVKRGEVFLMHCLCPHWVTTNQSDKPRIVAYFGFGDYPQTGMPVFRDPFLGWPEMDCFRG